MVLNNISMQPSRELHWIGVVLLFLLFLPIPFGADRLIISLSLISFCVIGTLAYGIKLTRISVTCAIVFIIYIAITTIISAEKDGIDFAPKQAARELGFGIMGFLVMHWGERKVFFYKLLDDNKEKIAYLLIAQLAVGTFFPVIMNTAVQIDQLPEVNSEVRIYMHPLGLMLMLLPLFQRRSLIFSVAAILIALATNSKQVVAYVLISIAILIYENKRASSYIIGLLIISLSLSMALYMGLGERILTFMNEGDQIRHGEIDAAIRSINSGTNIIHGIGFGVPYWGGWASVIPGLDDSDAWVENSQYEVHNGYLSLTVRVGIIGVLFLLASVVRILSSLPRQIACQMGVYISMSLASSISFFYMDFIYFSIAVSYIRIVKNNFKECAL
jgi:hypothetical protein